MKPSNAKSESRALRTAATPPAAIPSPTPAPSSVATFPEDVERRGPGRPPKLCDRCGKSATECKCSKAELAPKFETDTTKKILAGIFRTVGGALAITTGVDMDVMRRIWELTEGELMLMGPMATDLANKYADDFLKLFQTEIAFAVTVLPIVAIKATVSRKVIAEFRKANPKPSKEAAPPTPVDTSGARERAAAA